MANSGVAWIWLDRVGMRPLALGTILVATDLDPADEALRTGRRLAQGSGATLHVVHVDEPPSSSGTRARLAAAPADALDRAIEHAGIPRGEVRLHHVPGHPAEGICAIAELVAADVIILGPPRPQAAGTNAPPLGGTAMAVVLGTDAPCLVAARPLPVPLERVIVPVDLSDTSRGALLVGLSWASALRAGSFDAPGTALTVLHVRHEDQALAADAEAALAREVDRLRRDAGSWAGVRIEATTRPARDGAARSIDAVARELRADLVVLGTRGLGADEERRLGSVAAAVIELTPAPMLLVPPAVWRAHAADL